MVSRCAESFRGREKLAQRHCLTECEPLGEDPLGRFDLAHEGSLWFRPRWIERRVIPGVGRALRKLSLDNGQDLFGTLLCDREEAHVRLGIGDHKQLGQSVGVVAGVVGEDVRRQFMFGFGAFLVLEDRC